MPKYEHTDVYQLDSLEQVDLFCSALRTMKADAPLSLRLTVAVTASRDVEFKPNSRQTSRHPHCDLDSLSQCLARTRQHRKLKRRRRLRGS